MTPKDALELLENRISTLAINHKIGSRYIANLEIKDIVTCIETHVIPTITNTIVELDDYKHNYKALKEFYDNSVAYGSKIQNELNELKRNVTSFLKLVTKPTWLNFVEGANYDHLKDKLSKVGKEE